MQKWNSDQDSWILLSLCMTTILPASLSDAALFGMLTRAHLEPAHDGFITGLPACQKF